MSKTNFKAFAYSFCTSLFVIFSISRAFDCAQTPQEQEIKIPGKNIVLFLQGSAQNPSTRSAPVKKIALTKLDDVKTLDSATTDRNSNSNIVYEPDNEVIMADVRLLSDGDEEGNVVPPLKTADLSLNAPKAVIYETSLSEPLPKETLEPLPSKENSLPSPRIYAEKTSEPEKISIPSKAQVSASLPLKNKEAPVLHAKLDAPIPLLRDVNTANRSNYIVRADQEASENQVALADKTIPIKSMQSENSSSDSRAQDKEVRPWNSMKEKQAQSPSSNPWVVAQSAGAKQNSLLKSEDFYKTDNKEIAKLLNNEKDTSSAKEVLLAAETARNLLIPIPEDILKEENLTPQLVSSSKQEELEKEAIIKAEILKEMEENDKGKKDSKAEKGASKTTLPIEDAQTNSNQTPVPQEDSKTSILSSLGSIFKSETRVKEAPKQNKIKKAVQRVINRPKRPKAKIMPTEMRLSFQSNRAEISGQTLRWIQAFAGRAADSDTTGLEIRIDGTSSMDLQQKRLNLLHNILTSRGVEFNKINTVFTNREPNSFIIRTITLNSASKDTSSGYFGSGGGGTHLQW